MKSAPSKMEVLDDWFKYDESLRGSVQSQVNGSLESLNEMIRSHSDNSDPILHNPIFMSGSTVEAGALCRCVAGEDVDLDYEFGKDVDSVHDLGQGLEVEYDLMNTFGVIKDTEMGDKLLIPAEGHDGYFYLRGDPDGSVLFPFYRDRFSSKPEGHDLKALSNEKRLLTLY